MSGFHIATASLRSSADALVEVVDRMAAAFTELETTLLGYGSPWGTGLLGTTIGGLYEDVHDLAMSSYEANAEVISEYAEGLDAMADEVDAIDNEIESGFELFHEQLGSRFQPAEPQ
jgi:hypothetical protein